MAEEAKVLPSMIYRFSVQLNGEESGIVFIGEFVYKRPSIGARSSIHVLSSTLNGDKSTLEPEIQELNFALAHLRFTLDEYPDWWSESSFGLNLYDRNVIFEIYTKCIEFEKNWKIKVHGTDKSSNENGTDTDESSQATEKFVRGKGEQ